MDFIKTASSIRLPPHLSESLFSPGLSTRLLSSRYEKSMRCVASGILLDKSVLLQLDTFGIE